MNATATRETWLMLQNTGRLTDKSSDCVFPGKHKVHAQAPFWLFPAGASVLVVMVTTAKQAESVLFGEHGAVAGQHSPVPG